MMLSSFKQWLIQLYSVGGYTVVIQQSRVANRHHFFFTIIREKCDEIVPNSLEQQAVAKLLENLGDE